MNILVCIKQVPDDSVEIHLNAEGTPDLANVTPVVNAFDTYALEMAARLKESSEGEVTVVCVGEDSAKNSLKNCLAVGADHAFLVSDDAFKGSDTTGIANILKNVIAKSETAMPHASTAHKMRANTVHHQIMICPPKSGGRISINTNISTGSIKINR